MISFYELFYPCFRSVWHSFSFFGIAVHNVQKYKREAQHLLQKKEKSFNIFLNIFCFLFLVLLVQFMALICLIFFSFHLNFLLISALITPDDDHPDALPVRDPLAQLSALRGSQ